MENFSQTMLEDYNASKKYETLPTSDSEHKEYVLYLLFKRGLRDCLEVGESAIYQSYKEQYQVLFLESQEAVFCEDHDC